MRWILFTLLMLANSAALAATLEGELVLRWGDATQAGSEERLQADLVLDGKTRIALHAASLRQVGGDLSALDGRRVRVAQGNQTADGLREVSALHAIDSIDHADKSQQQVDRPWITLLCKFADVAAEPRSHAHIDAILGAQGWMGDYWAEQSGGRTSATGNQVKGWYVLPHPRSHYVQPGQYARLDRLFNDCTAAALDDVDFNQGGAGITGINLLFNAALDCCAWGGGMFATLQGTTQRWSVTWNPPFAYINPAALAHEMGHGYGLPHANNTDRDIDTYDNPWDLMSDALGHAEKDPVFGLMPKRLGGYNRARLGWIESDRLGQVLVDGVHRFELSRAGVPDGAGFELVELRHPDWDAERWLSLELRHQDDAFDANLPGSAVIVHEIDTRRPQPAWVVDRSTPVAGYSNTSGNMLTVGEQYRDSDGEFELRVLADTGTGFEVELRVVRPIFQSRFGAEG